MPCNVVEKPHCKVFLPLFCIPEMSVGKQRMLDLYEMTSNMTGLSMSKRHAQPLALRTGFVTLEATSEPRKVDDP